MVPIACYGVLDLVVHSVEDVVVTLNNVAHARGLGLLSFSLHDVDRQKIVTIDPVGSTWRPDVWFSRVMTLVVG